MEKSTSTSTHCANCNNSLENIRKVSKILCKGEMTGDILVYDALADIYGNGISSMFSQSGNEVFLCGCCASLLSAYYTIHKKVKNTTHPSSLFKRLKKFRNEESKCEAEGLNNTHCDPDLSNAPYPSLLEDGHGIAEEEIIFEDIYHTGENENLGSEGEIETKCDPLLCPESFKVTRCQNFESGITKDVVIKLKKLSPEELQKVYGIKIENTATGRTRGGFLTTYRKYTKSNNRKVFRRRGKPKQTADDGTAKEKTKHNCLECGKTLSSTCALVHKQIHHSIGEKKFSCDICHRRFHILHILKRHVRLVHLGERNFVCHICGRGCTTKSNLKIHLLTHDAKKTHSEEKKLKYVCQVKECAKSYRTKQSLDTHVKKKHREVGEVKEVGGVFPCEECSKIFDYSSSLEKHRNFVHLRLKGSRPRKEHVCKICGKSYLDKDSYNLHMRMHSEDYMAKFLCNECGRGVHTKQALREHLRSHSGVKEFSCDICSKMFMTMTHVKRHKMTVHNSVMRFWCEICGKPFQLRSYLNDHLKRHNKKKMKESAKIGGGLQETNPS